MTQKRWKISLLAAALLAAVCLSLGLSFAATTDGFSEVTIAEYQTYGSELSVPKATYTAGGKTVDASAVLYYPDGRVSSAARPVLDCAGVYSLEYAAYTEGGYARMTKDFTVRVAAYSAKNPVSTMTYGEYEGTRGLLCNIVTGDTLTFSQVIDLNKKTENDLLAKLFVIPSTPGAADFEKLEFTLTDIYDENNQVTIVHIPYNNNPASHGYTKAAASGQLLTGYESGRDMVHVNNVYGTPTYFIYQPTKNFTANTISISMNYETKSVYANKALVADLDDQKFFTKLWSGFTTGEVRLSIKPGSGTVARFMVTEAAGASLSVAEYDDTDAPILNVDTGNYGDEIPHAVAGKPYPIFSATAFDRVFGTCDVTVKVWRNYYSSAKYQYPIENGAFTPDKTGEYVLEYSAKDGFRNVGTKILTVTAVQASETDALEILLTGETTEGLAGIAVPFGQASAAGGVGDKKVEVSVADENGVTVEADSEGFLPKRTGVYTVTYTAVDYVGNVAEKSYSVTVKPNPEPVFERDALVQKYLIAGYGYTFPALSATDYSGENPVPVDASVSVLVEGAETQVNGSYVPDAALDGKTITVRYTARGAKGTGSKDYSARIVNVKDGNALDFSKFFVWEGDAKVNTKKETFIAYRANDADNVKLNYINPLSYREFSLKFMLNSTNVGRADIYLTGCADPSQVLKISFLKGSDSVQIRINDGYGYETTYQPKATFDVTFDSLLNRIASNGVFYSFDSFLNGTPFAGFTGETVWLRIEFGDYNGKNELFRVYSLNGQVFSSDTEEYIGPQIVRLGEYGGTKSIGSRATVAEAFAVDVLNPLTEFSVSVTDPNGDYVKDINGLTLNSVPYARYQFDLNSYGRYTITLVATDGAGNPSEIFYTENVVNTVGPTIHLSGNLPETVRAGTKFSPPAATATDDLTPSDQIVLRVFLQRPDGTVEQLTDSKNPENKIEVTLTAGVYTLTYLAIDGDGNATFSDYTVTVK